MAGHSQFKNIMHRKGAQDARRSRLFSKLSREITVAAKTGLPEPDKNPRLRLAIAAARVENMPKDNIDRAIKKALGNDMENYEEVRYEGFGPGGIGIIIETLTDNRNRTGGDVRAAFSKNGGNLGETGSVAFMFDRLGSVFFKPEVGDADAVMEAAIEAGADDVDSRDEGHEIVCAAESLGAVREALEAKFGESEHARLVWRPHNHIDVDDETAQKLLRLLETLDDHDDVQHVYGNYVISDAAVETYNS